MERGGRAVDAVGHVAALVDADAAGAFEGSVGFGLYEGRG